MENNNMREIKIEKIILSVGGTGEELEKGVRLLEFLTNKKAIKTKSKKRIPNFGIRPGLEVGAIITLRKDVRKFLEKMLIAIDNNLKKKQISNNNFSFGINEYIEIPEIEYQRDIGMRGLEITVVFTRTGKRIKRKKIKRGKIPKRQDVSKQEIIKFMEENFRTKFN